MLFEQAESYGLHDNHHSGASDPLHLIIRELAPTVALADIVDGSIWLGLTTKIGGLRSIMTCLEHCASKKVASILRKKGQKTSSFTRRITANLAMDIKVC